MTSLKPRRSAVLWGLHRSGGTSASPPPGSRQLGGVQCQEYTLQNKYCLEKMLSCCPFGCVFRKKINGDSKGKVQIRGQGGECTGFSSRDRNEGVWVQMHKGRMAEFQRRRSEVFLMKIT